MGKCCLCGFAAFQIPDLDAILVPVSGGGMLAGISVVAHLLQPKCQGEVETLHLCVDLEQ